MYNFRSSSLCRDFLPNGARTASLNRLCGQEPYFVEVCTAALRETGCIWDRLLNDCRVKIKSYQTKEQRYFALFPYVSHSKEHY